MTQKFYHVEKVNGSLKPCCDPQYRCHLIVCTSVLFKYIDSGRINEGVSIRDYVEKIKLEYNLTDPGYVRQTENLIEVRNSIFNPNLRLDKRIEALNLFTKYSGPVYNWKYYKRWNKICKD
jgi:hypothetical protein